MIPDPRHTGPRGSQWTPERDAELAELWGQGVVTAEIARRMGGGLTKSAVVGRAHRMCLPSRANPIKSAARFPRGRGGAATPCGRATRHLTPAGASTDAAALPDLKSPAKAGHDVPESGVGRASGQRHLMSQLETTRKGRFLGVSSLNSAPVVASNGAAGVLFGELRPDHCRWPLWGMERPAECTFCGCPKAEGRPYCAGHAARAFLPPKPIGPSAVKPDWNAAVGGGKAFEK
jgi:GcrA cell cycle regulator